MYLGIDDTDSREGMCTTFVGLKAIMRIIELGYDIIGYPRLVRLNPNIPWKTRGNGSVVIRFGYGSGERIKIGEMEGEEIYGYAREKKGKIHLSLDALIDILEKYFVIADENTNPGIVLTERKFPESLYWRAVRGLIEIEEIEELLRNEGAEYRKYKLGRGIIGATAGIAWRAKKKTYELLTYVPEEKFNSERFVDERSVIEMDRAIKSTFDNYDYENRYIAIMPNSKTPVLYGIRGSDPRDLIKAKSMVKGSEFNAFLIYETNQGTDDHLQRKKIKDIHSYESVILRGKVIERPIRIEGGHVIFKISDGTGSVECAAYEPTKGFRDVVMALYPGDEIEVYGGIRKDRFTVNIEKIRVIKTEEIMVKVENPTCPKCGRKMESIGKGKGYRCRKCGIKVGEEAAKYEELKRIKPGYYEVPVIARRHLAKPVKLIMENVF